MRVDLYNKTAERLWEKLEYHRGKITTETLSLLEPFPVDQLIEENPFVLGLIREVQKEFKYPMTEFQCSWAVVQFIKRGCKGMEEYNLINDTNLKPRP